jgi:hypothetical protein
MHSTGSGQSISVLLLGEDLAIRPFTVNGLAIETDKTVKYCKNSM